MLLHPLLCCAAAWHSTSGGLAAVLRKLWSARDFFGALVDEVTLSGVTVPTPSACGGSLCSGEGPRTLLCPPRGVCCCLWVCFSFSVV